MARRVTVDRSVSVHPLMHSAFPHFPQSTILSRAFAERGKEGVILWEVVRTEPGSRFRLTFESIRSDWRQGVWLRSTGGILVEGSVYESIYLWSDTAPSSLTLTARAEDGRLHLYNVWDRGLSVSSQGHSSGMILELVGGLRRYRCTDIGFDSHFDRLVFSLARLEE